MKRIRLPVNDKNGRELECENAIIKSVSISNADHGCLSAWLNLEFNGGGCGFGGYKIGNADGGNLSQKNYAAEWIVRCLNTVGVTEWEKLPGKSIRCLNEGLGGRVVAIGHFLKDEWFCPRIEFDKDIGEA